MDTRTIVKYVSYAVMVGALVSLVSSAPLQVILIAAVVAVNKFYVNA